MLVIRVGSSEPIVSPPRTEAAECCLTCYISSARNGDH
jgi:hypothetical protein